MGKDARWNPRSKRVEKWPKGHLRAWKGKHKSQKEKNWDASVQSRSRPLTLFTRLSVSVPSVYAVWKISANSLDPNPVAGGCSPLEGAPSLQTGTHSSYNLSASISFLQTCETLGSTAPSGAILCPMVAACNTMVANCPMSTNMNGTISWAVTDLTSTSVSLNVTRDLTISNGDQTRPTINSSSSFSESIDLASRLVTLFPTIMPEIDQFLQMAKAALTTNLTGTNLTASIDALGVGARHQVHTMWWVNGPLKLNQTIPVLVFPTNVTGTSTVDLGGSLGTRDASALTFNFSRAMFDPIRAPGLNSLVSDSLLVGFVFNYDKSSDILLSATVDIHAGFQEEIALPPPPCDPSMSKTCPVTGLTTVITNSSLSVEAALKLASTTADLSQRMTQSIRPPNGGGLSGNGPSNGNGSAPNNGSGSNNGIPGSGSDSRNSGSSWSAGQPSSNPNQPADGAQISGWPVWLYGLIGIAAAVIVSILVWISRRRSKRSTIENQLSQASSSSPMN